MQFTEDELVTLERILKAISRAEWVSDRLYRSYAKILERIQSEIDTRQLPNPKRRIRN